ncbi:hypothetical protein VTJ83DRAFT_4936 [Remersonia thermophila]|uniref:SigF-like NTF2-like domain-containing protein n=1 Tax=Remersonia thermophila TaxID=72144 RepID=A0ABR4DDF1_9PEZI
MENPAREIESVVRSLTQGSPDEQRNAIYRYYAPGAAFEHPFCRVPSFKGVHVPGIGNVDSRALIAAIYRWYKILSPGTRLSIDSCAHDPQTQTLYLSLTQTFSIRFLPFHRAPVRLTSVLHLAEAPPATPAAPSAAAAPAAASATGASSPGDGDDHATMVHPTPPPPYDAAQEKLHAVQEGAEPSYAAVTAGDASASPPRGKRRRSSSASASASGRAKTGAKPGAAGGEEERGKGQEKKAQRWVIEAQWDFYTAPDQARLVAGVSPASAVIGVLQLVSMAWCVAAAAAAERVLGMLRPVEAFVVAGWEYLRLVAHLLWNSALGEMRTRVEGSRGRRVKGSGKEKKAGGRI